MNVARRLWMVCVLGVACSGGDDVDSSEQLSAVTSAQAGQLCSELAAEFPVKTTTCGVATDVDGVDNGDDGAGVFNCLVDLGVGFGPETPGGCEATVGDAINCERATYEDPCGANLSVLDDACAAIYLCENNSVNTPLVVAFDSQPVRFTSGGTFAFVAGNPVATDLPTATTPWIALDRNHDGTIDNGSELFGSYTVLADGTHAPNGFVALAELDADHDGRIDAADPAFASLVLWADRDGDGRSTPDELTPLASRIVSLSLADHVEQRCDARSNCEGERAGITWRDATGALRDGTVIDVYLH